MTTTAWAWGAVLAGFSVATGFAAWRFRGRLADALTRGGGSDRDGLFEDLCREHGLTSEESAWLARAAIAARLNGPAELFVSPEAWDRVCAALPRAEGQRVEGMYERLFL